MRSPCPRMTYQAGAASVRCYWESSRQFSGYDIHRLSPRCDAATRMSCHSQRRTRRPNTREPGRAARNTGQATDMATDCGQRMSAHAGSPGYVLFRAGSSRYTNQRRTNLVSILRWRTTAAARRIYSRLSARRRRRRYSTSISRSSGQMTASAQGEQKLTGQARRLGTLCRQRLAHISCLKPGAFRTR